jgi:DNA-directed RNA polymerase subunit RPC12/RpoP
MKQRIRIPIEVECPHCGHGWAIAMPRHEQGMGAEMLLKCASCGAEDWGELSEETKLLVREWVGRQTQ